MISIVKAIHLIGSGSVKGLMIGGQFWLGWVIADAVGFGRPFLVLTGAGVAWLLIYIAAKLAHH